MTGLALLSQNCITILFHHETYFYANCCTNIALTNYTRLWFLYAEIMVQTELACSVLTLINSCTLFFSLFKCQCSVSIKGGDYLLSSRDEDKQWATSLRCGQLRITTTSETNLQCLFDLRYIYFFLVGEMFSMHNWVAGPWYFVSGNLNH